jgi:soluble P-type ATPase
MKARRVAIYWDSQNVNFTDQHGESVFNVAQTEGRVVISKIYYNSQFQKKLEKFISNNFKFFDVPYGFKNSLDNHLKSHLWDDLDSNYCPNTVIIISGDGDFKSLVNNLKKLEIKVIIIANANVNRKLQEAADIFYCINDLPDLVKRINEKKVDSDESYLSWEMAIAYLTQTIATVKQQGKQTKMSLIANRMCQLFPQYKGVKSIHKHDGTTFKQFKKFVESLVNEGKIKINNDQLFLT